MILKSVYKRSFLLSGCFFFLFESYSQFSPHVKYTLDTLLYMNNLNTGQKVNDYASYNVNDSESICLYKIKNKFCLETYHFKTRKCTKKMISNKEINRISMGYHFTFALTNDTLIIFRDSLMLAYSLSNDRIFQRKKINNITYSHVNHHKIYYGRFYNHLPGEVEPACLYMYDLHSGRFDSVILKHDYMEYTHYMPARFVAFGRDEIIYPDLGSYKIYIQNKDLKTLDSVTRTIPDWISPPRELNRSIAANPKDLTMYFPLLDKECLEHMDRIEFVEFIDTNKFLVRWYRYDTSLQYRKRIIDIWTRTNGTYELSRSYYETIHPLPMDHFMLTNGIPLRSDEYDTHYTKEYIIQLKSDLALDPRDYKTYREYLEKREEYGKKKEPVVSFWIFKKL